MGIRNTSIAANTSNNDSNNGTTHDANSIRNIRNYNYNYNYANQSGDDHLRKTNNAPVGYGQQQFGIVPQIKLEFGGDNVGHTEPSRSNVNNNTIVGVSDIQQHHQHQHQQEQQQYYHQQHPLALHRQYRQQSSVNTNGQALLAPNVGNYATANANNMFVHNEHTTAATTTAASTTTSSRPTTRTSATTTQLPPSTTSTKSALTSATPEATIAVSAAAESSRTTTTTATTTTSTMTTDEETGVAFDAPTNDLPLSPFDFVTETVPTLDMGAAHTFTGAESLMWDTEQLDSVIGDFLHSQILHQT